MIVLSDTGGIAETNCYLVADEATSQAVLFDAPDHTVGPLLDEVGRRGWDLIGLWLTHGHFDHIADHAPVTARFPNVKVLIHRLDESKLTHPRLQLSLFMLPPSMVPPGKADGFVEDGQELRIGGLWARVIHTPGHAPGHVVYHFAEEKVLIGGDLIMMGSVGRTDLPDSDPAALDESIRRVVKAVPPDTRLLPGHGGPSTIEEELRDNPYVQKAVAGRRVVE